MLRGQPTTRGILLQPEVLPIHSPTDRRALLLQVAQAILGVGRSQPRVMAEEMRSAAYSPSLQIGNMTWNTKGRLEGWCIHYALAVASLFRSMVMVSKRRTWYQLPPLLLNTKQASTALPTLPSCARTTSSMTSLSRFGNMLCSVLDIV